MNNEAWLCPKCKNYNSFWRANCAYCDHIEIPKVK